jgi:hypothetical protein
MKSILSIFILFFGTVAMGQNYSRVHHPNGLAIYGSSCMLLANDTVFSVSFARNSPNRLIFRSFNRSGTLLDSSYYHFADTNNVLVAIRGNSLNRISATSLVSIHDFFRTDNLHYTTLVKLNTRLDTIQTRIFRPDSSLTFNSWDILVEDTAITLMGHYSGPDKKLHLFIARFDTLLNLQWHTTIQDFRPIANQYFNGYYPFRIRRMGNHYYIAGRCLYANQFVEGFLVKTDLQGNLLWDKRYQYNNLNSVITDIEFIRNDSIFALNNFLSKEIGNDSYNKLRFFLSDTSGTIIKDTVYPDEEIVYIAEKIRSHDNNLLVIGNYYLGGSKAVIWKLDKNLNTIWRRVYYYGDWEDESWLYNVDQWSDGGIIAAGTYFDRYMNPTNQSVFVWLLSTDSLGCLGAGNCGSNIGVVDWALPGQGIAVYPNPAKGYVNINLTQAGQQDLNAVGRFFNAAGQEVLKQNLKFVAGYANLQLPQLPQGKYVLELKTATQVFYEKIVVE